MEDRSDSERELSITLSTIPIIDPSTLKPILKTTSSYSPYGNERSSSNNSSSRSKNDNNNSLKKRELQVKFVPNTKFSNEDHIALCIDRFDYIKDKGFTEYFIKVHLTLNILLFQFHRSLVKYITPIMTSFIVILLPSLFAIFLTPYIIHSYSSSIFYHIYYCL